MSDFNNSVSMAGVGQGLDKALDAAFEKLDIKDQDFEPTPLPPAETEEPPTAESAPDDEFDAKGTEGKDQQKDGTRQRDPKGKFASDKAADPNAAKPGTEPSRAESPTSAPAHWDTQRKEAFGKLTADAQKIVLDISKGLEAAHTKRSTEFARDRELATGIRSAMTAEHKEQLRRAGLDEVAGVRQLLEYHDMATKDFPGYVKTIVQKSGRSPRNIWPDPRPYWPEFFTGAPGQPQPMPQGQAQPPALHPQIVQALQTIAGRVQNIEKTQTEGQRLKEEAENSRLIKVVDEWENEVGPDGQLLRPHFAARRDEIFEQLQAPSVLALDDPRQRLQRAYSRAVYGDDELRGSLVQSEAQRIAQQKQQEADVAKARRARPLPLNGTQAPIQGARVRTLDDALDAARRKLGV